MKKSIYLVIALLSLVLTGCVSLQVPKATSEQTSFQVVAKSTRAAKLKKIKSWNIRGAFSVVQRGKSAIANYDWKQSGMSRYRIRIASALNLYNIYIVGKPDFVTLVESSKKRYTAPTPEVLMQRALGWTLPISQMYYWVRGLPAPGRYSPRYDKFGHLIRLRQLGWSVIFNSYIRVGKVDLPRLITLSTRGLRVKIVIKYWSY